MLQASSNNPNIFHQTSSSSTLLTSQKLLLPVHQYLTNTSQHYISSHSSPDLQPTSKMKFSTIVFSLVSILSTTTLVTAHPPIFAPNHATLQKRCPPFDPAGVKNIGNGAGGQFIGGQCLSAADCASGCCANPCGICSGVGAQTQAGKTGCGFGGAGGSSSTSSSTSNGNNGANTNSNSNENNNGGSSTNTGSGSSTCNANN